MTTNHEQHFDAFSVFSRKLSADVSRLILASLKTPTVETSHEDEDVDQSDADSNSSVTRLS